MGEWIAERGKRTYMGRREVVEMVGKERWSK